jgi:hypothetical protein
MSIQVDYSMGFNNMKNERIFCKMKKGKIVPLNPLDLRSVFSYLYCILYRKFERNIPRNGTARPCSQFLHSCICERFIYSHDRSANAIQQNRQTMVICKSLTHRKKKVREFPVPSRDVTTKLSLGGNNDVITELFLLRRSLVSDIPAGDGKLVNLFLQWIHECRNWERGRAVSFLGN